jgi:hypothetical protein
MKHSEIEIGHEYLTRIGSQLERVTVLHETTRSPIGSTRAMRKFVVRHGDRVLPKARSASALRPVT